MFLSVIIPCYNAEPWMARCLDSILNQGIGDMEVICVNDGSKDDTLAILRDYETRYPNVVKVIDKENGGVSSARNVGIDAATGTYITFVDADDTLVDGALPIAIQSVKQTEVLADLAHLGMRIVSRGGDVELHVKNKRQYEDFDIEYLMSLDALEFGSPCSKFYKRNIISKFNISFDTSMPLYEDEKFNIEFLKYTKSIMVLELEFYIYLRNNNSATAKFRGDQFSDCNNEILRCRKEFFMEHFGRDDRKLHIYRQHAFDYLFAIYSIYRANRVKGKYHWLKRYWNAANLNDIRWSYNLDSGIPKLIGFFGRKNKILCHCFTWMVFSMEKLLRRNNG